MKSFLKEFSDFEDSVLMASAEVEREKRLAFASKIKARIEQAPSDPDLYHTLGLCLYGIPTWEQSEKYEIEIAFMRTLLIDPVSIFSLAFLAFFYFDTQEYELCLKACERVRSLAPGSHLQRWRRVKLNSIRVACLVQTGANNASLREETLDLFKEFGSLDSEEAEMAAPAELLAAFDERADPELRDLVSRLKELINSIEVE